MYVIAGVSGHTGSVVATTLLASKQPVRVIVRDAAKGEEWKARGAEVAVASLDDQAALTRALAGATGAYLLLPPPAWTATGIAEERARTSASILGAVKAAKPGHVVLLSSIGAQHASGTGPIRYLHALEEGLRASGVPSTLLRAGYFMENWASQLGAAISTGTVYHAVDRTLPQVATTDIGRTAARLLVEGAPTGTRVVNIYGPADLSRADSAKAFSAVAGKPVEIVVVPPSAVAQQFTSQGASQELASDFEQMLVAMNAGLITADTGDTIRGTVTLEQRLRELKN